MVRQVGGPTVVGQLHITNAALGFNWLGAYQLEVVPHSRRFLRHFYFILMESARELARLTTLYLFLLLSARV